MTAALRADAAAILAELEAAGVRLWAEDARLRFRAPQGVLTEERRARLLAAKPELLAYLAEAESGRIEPEPAARHEPFPLTDIQAAYLMGRRTVFAYGGVGCHAYGEVRLRDLDPERVRDAWQALVDRHDMLRAVIDANGSQRVLAEVPPVRVAATDLRGRPAEEVEAHVAAVRAAMDHRVYEPHEWPLFDLAVTRADDGALLHVSIDFLIADFVSIQLLLTEFQEHYTDPDLVRPPLDVTFRDYLAAERRLRGTRRYERAQAYWFDRIDTLPAAPDLPVLGDQSAGDPVRFRRHELRLDGAGYAALREAAAAHGLSPTAAVLTAYAEVIGRWSRRRRFVLNLTMLNRLPLHPQVDRLVGDFTSAVLLEVDGAEGTTLAERGGALQRRLWQDLDHRLVGGVTVLRELARRRGADAALMPVVFTSALGLGDTTAPGPEAGETGYGISQTPQVWIDCQALERGDGLELHWDVRQGVFPDGVAEDMFAAFGDLVRRLAGDAPPWSQPSPVDLPERQRRRRAEVNDTAAPLSGRLLHSGVVEQCRRTPDRPAVLSGERTLTYGELLGRAGAVAAALRERGCVPGDIVAIVMHTGWEQPVAALGALLAGGVYLPIDTRSPRARRDALLSGAGARHVLATAATADGLDAPILVERLDPVEPDERLLTPVVGPADLAYVIYTSGSTGTPKGVMIDHRGAVNTVEDVNARFGVGPDDRVLALASLAFDLSVYDLFGPLAVGGALVLPDHDRRADPSHWVDTMLLHSVTLWNSVPAQMQMLADYLTVEAGVDLPSLRLALLSGDWIPVTLPDQIRGRLPGLRLVSLGGATEASIWSIHHPIEAVPPHWRSIPYGTPLTNQTFHVLDEAGRDCPDWTVGELYIGGVGVAAGYLGDPEQTARRFSVHEPGGERRYRTGDLGRYRPDGVIEFLGREDDQVKIRGHRIELAEVEAAMQSHPAVGAAVAFVEGEPPLDRRLAAVVETAHREPDREAAVRDTARLLDGARRRLAEVRREMDADAAVAFARELDRTALLAMVTTLRGAGLFRTAGSAHTLPEVLDAARVAPKHHRLVRRWVKGLIAGGMMRRDGDLLTGVPPVTADDVAAAWARVDELLPGGGHRPELVEYFRAATTRLPELLRDDADPIQLLFPEGRLDIQESAYQGNFLSDTVNRLVVEAMCTLAADFPAGRPMQVLEVGAGVGGTSIDLIPALAAHPVRYLFTDVSTFFLNAAQERFAAYPWVGYGIYDLNADYRAQGLESNAFDVILCANVLHYARHAGRALARFREMLRPGGWLVFIETTRDNYQILTSMEFLFDATAGDFEDVRAGQDETFISRPQWQALLSEAGASTVVCLSDEDEALDRIGMHVFAVRFKADRVPVTPAEITAHLGERLPGYMVPGTIGVVDALPLTGNGKVDRAALPALLRAPELGGAAPVSAEPSGEVEIALAKAWAEVLGVPTVGRDHTIFQLGGDSLLAAQLVARIRESVPAAADAFFDQMLRDLLEGCTLAELAAGLGAGSAAEPRSGGETGPGGPVALVGLDGPGPDVLVHDGTGGLPPVAGDLAAAGSGLVVTAPQTYLGLDPAVLVDWHASACADVLAGTAPLALAGRDFGALLAVEVARRRLEQGGEVSRLVAVVTEPFTPDLRDDLLVEYAFARALGVAPPDVGLPAEADLARAVEAAGGGVLPPGRLTYPPAGQEAPGVTDVLLRQTERPAGERLAAIAGRAGLTGAETERRYEMFRHSLDAAARHRAEPYAGDVTLVLAFDGERWPSAAEAIPARWRDLCLGAVDVRWSR
ncbi:amino acid adenylation domain-containing protein [Micromonospora aurantiaca (nom. illeg.)]|uniref:amino acid adenylation domain-containing protein n=1 Tax=Micromonospora aurantiaca (nom. illeg.) TaxID=47850 RepID=UPI0033FBA7B1